MEDFDLDAFLAPDGTSSAQSHLHMMSDMDDETISLFCKQCPTAELETALLVCMQAGCVQGLRTIVERRASIDGDTAEAAARSGDQAIVDLVLSRGWPVNQALRHNSVASMLCYAVEQPLLVAHLLTQGADPNMQSNTGATPLSWAVIDGPICVIEMLLNTGGDVNKGDLLHYAVQRQAGDTATLIRLLIDRGADPNARQFEDPSAYRLRGLFPHDTPLYAACFQRNLEAIRALLERGADPTMLRLRGGELSPPNPLDLARRSGDEEIVSWMEQRALEISTRVLPASRANI